MAVSARGVTLQGADLPAGHARLLLAILSVNHRSPISHDQLAHHLWDGAPPSSWPTALRGLVSRLRRVLLALGFDSDLIEGGVGYYQLQLPAGSLLDVECARSSVHTAERGLARGEVDAACAQALVAAMITRRPALPDAPSAWSDDVANEMWSVRTRALTVLCQTWLARGDLDMAIGDSQRLAALDPLIETGHRVLMESHLAAGNPAKALHAYENCRRALLEIGASPGPETRASYTRILSSS